MADPRKESLSLDTKRLHLWMPSPERAASVASYYQRNRDFLAPWDPPRPSGFLTEPYWRERLHRHRQEYREGYGLRLMLREREEPQTIYGSINLTGITQGAFHAANLGYSLDATRTGRGYMTEALEEVIRFAFDELNLHRVAASHMPENKSSARVLEKLSFVREGYAADYLFIAGAWRDHVLCSRTNPDFQMPTSEG